MDITEHKIENKEAIVDKKENMYQRAYMKRKKEELLALEKQ